jgi:hypothetical protein
MKSARRILVMSLAVMAFVACQKEDGVDRDGYLKLTVEGMNGGNKMAIDGVNSYWADGDVVNINGQECPVVFGDGGGAYTEASDFDDAAAFYGVYPASIYVSNVGNSYTLTLPAEYTYATTEHSGTKQNLQSPMVAYALPTATELQFKHLTAAITVEVKNDFGIDVKVTNVTISSNKYKQHGSVTVDVTSDLSSIVAVESATASDRQVEMNFTGTPCVVASGSTQQIQLPVLPVGDDNRFTISVTVQNVDDAAMEYTFTKTQGDSQAAYALGRAKMGFAPAKFGGVFTVADGRRVRFAPGNLQYQASTGTWRFAQHQYDAIGNAAGNSVFDDSRSTQAAWIDLFGWGTSGWENRDSNEGKDTIIYYRPYDYMGNIVGSSAYGYGPRHKEGYVYTYTFSLVGDYENSDWGVYNAISNGGNTAGQWRTLTGGTGKEWEYLMKTRGASTVSGVSNARYLKAKVNNINGYIIFPDDFILPEGIDITNSQINISSYLAWTNVSSSLTSADWMKMEVAGAIFLPCTGYRSYSSNNPSFTADNGYYWSSSYYNAQNAYNIQMGGGSPMFDANSAKRIGCSVRLVRDVE